MKQHVARRIVAGFAMLLVVAGLVVAFSSAPLSGGHLIAGPVLVGFGAGLLIQQWRVRNAARRRGRK